MVAHITAEELRRYLSATEQANGFGNRFGLPTWLVLRTRSGPTRYWRNGSQGGTNLTPRGYIFRRLRGKRVGDEMMRCADCNKPSLCSGTRPAE